MKPIGTLGGSVWQIALVLAMGSRITRGQPTGATPPPPRGVAAPGASLQLLASGCDGVPFAFTEGCSSDSAGNVYFTDQPNDRILKYDTAGKLTVFMQPCGRSNGTCVDATGNLVSCADEQNQLWSISPDRKVTVLVKDYQGKLLNGPNDVWIRPDGGLYITDPYYQRNYWHRGPEEQGYQGVYFLSADRRRFIRVTEGFKKSNGIIGMPDGKQIYISDIGAGRTYRYDIQPDGTLTNKTLYCEMGSDGMTLDDAGNVYLTGHGVTVFNAAGEKIDYIEVNQPWTGNICFGGADRHTLFITASKGLYSLRTRTAGVGSQ